MYYKICGVTCIRIQWEGEKVMFWRAKIILGPLTFVYVLACKLSWLNSMHIDNHPLSFPSRG